MKKMFIIIGLFLLVAPNVFASEDYNALSQDYFDIAQDYFNQGDYQNSSEYVDFALQLEPENAKAIELKNKIHTIANTPIGVKEEPKIEIKQEQATTVQQNAIAVPEFKPDVETKPVVDVKQETKVEPIAEPKLNQEIKIEPIIKPIIKPELKQEQSVAPSNIEPHVCPVDLSPTQTAEIVNSQVETPAEIEQFMILELPRANISDMEYPKYTKFQKNLLNFIDDLIVAHPNRKSLYYAKLKIYKYKNDDARYDELSEFIIKKFEQVK